MQTPNLPAIRACRPAWNKGRIVGQKRPLILSASTPTCAFMPKYQSLPFFVLVISGSRVPALFLVEDGASMRNRRMPPFQVRTAAHAS